MRGNHPQPSISFNSANFGMMMTHEFIIGNFMVHKFEGKIDTVFSAKMK